MSNRLQSLAPAMLLLVLFCGTVQAHPDHAGIADFWSGLLHPMTGLDHLLAMVAVGLWSAFRGPHAARSTTALPLLFVSGAALGTSMGLAGIFDGHIEFAVAASLLPLGAALLFGLSSGHRAALCLVALCGALHGGAHGREFAQGVSVAAFAGFLLGTALVHAFGAGLCVALPSPRRRLAIGGVGGGLAVASVWLLA